MSRSLEDVGELIPAGKHLGECAVDSSGRVFVEDQLQGYFTRSPSIHRQKELHLIAGPRIHGGIWEDYVSYLEYTVIALRPVHALNPPV